MDHGLLNQPELSLINRPETEAASHVCHLYVAPLGRNLAEWPKCYSIDFQES